MANNSHIGGTECTTAHPGNPRGSPTPTLLAESRQILFGGYSLGDWLKDEEALLNLSRVMLSYMVKEGFIK